MQLGSDLCLQNLLPEQTCLESGAEVWVEGFGLRGLGLTKAEVRVEGLGLRKEAPAYVRSGTGASVEGVDSTHRPHSSSFLGFICRFL